MYIYICVYVQYVPHISDFVYLFGVAILGFPYGGPPKIKTESLNRSPKWWIVHRENEENHH